MIRSTLLLLLFLGLSTSLLLAQAGDLVVFTTDGAKVHLALDNKFQNKDGATYVKITDIPEGNYWVTLLFDNNRKAVKSNIRVLGNQENSFVVDRDGESWKLKTYSSVPRSQVAANDKMTIAYNSAGVTVDGIDNANDLAKSEVEQENRIVRVHGTRDDLGDAVERGRAGTYSGTAMESEPATASAQPLPEEGTTITKRYIETKNPDGTVSITEEATTVIKTLVDRGGQQQLRTRRSVALTPTNYTCLPMDQAQFETLLSKARGLQDAERLQFLQKDLSQQCLAPNQIKLLGDLFQDEQTRQTYAQVALPSNADPDNFPYDMKDLAVADPTIDRIEDGLEDNPQERVNTELDLQTKDVAEARSDAPIEAVEAVEDVPTPEPVAKTKAEIRAEKRLAKAQARAEKKAAKAKARAEKKAAKARAKAERANNK